MRSKNVSTHHRNQLSSTNTNFNTTLNLTGHILLGLGIATSLLLVMFLEAYDQEAFGRKRKKVKRVRVLLHARERRTNHKLCAQREIGDAPTLLTAHEDFLPTILDVLELRVHSEIFNGTTPGARASGVAERCSLLASCLANSPDIRLEFGTLGDALKELRK